METGKYRSSLQEKLARFEQACRKAGLKLTHQRLAVYRELAAATDHPSAEMLHCRLKSSLPTISLDTVYRTLTTLEQYGLVRKVETIESQARYEAEMHGHHHLICSRCKKIIDFHWPDFDEIPLPEGLGDFGRIRNRSVVLSGICRRCLEKKADA